MGKCFSFGNLPCKFSILILAYLHWDCTGILAYFYTFAYFYTCTLTLGCFLPLHWDTYRRVCVQVSVWKRQCSSVSVEMSVFKCKGVSVSVEVSVFKGFSGRTPAMLSGTQILEEESFKRNLYHRLCHLFATTCNTHEPQ